MITGEKIKLRNPKQESVLMEENYGEIHCQNEAVDDENRRRRHYNQRFHGDEVECSGERYRSCAAAAIADCVALCCCPCAIINLLTLTFVKVPWMIGRRCFGGGGRNKKKRKLKIHKRCRGIINGDDEFDHQSNKHHHQFDTLNGREKCGGIGCCGGGAGNDDHWFVVERDGSLTKEDEKTTSFGVDDDQTRISARVEAERVWLELYQIGHLGFGRVSSTEIQ